MGAATRGNGADATPVTVLLIGDDPRIADFMSRGLRASGFALEWVTSAGDALARLDRGGIDIQILDLGLPDMDGLDLMRESATRGHRVPTVVVTARTDANDRREAMALGAVDYLTKPFAWKDLVAALRASCGTPVD